MTASSAGARARTPPAAPAAMAALVHLHQPRDRAAADRPRPARYRRHLGHALQRRAPSSRRRARPCHAASWRGAARAIAAISAIDIALLGHSGQVARRAGLAAARRPQGRPHAGLCLRRLGRRRRRSASSSNRYIAKGGFKAVKMRVGAMDGAAARLGRARQGGARSARARHRADGRRAWHIHGRRGQALRPSRRRLRPRLVRGAGRSPTTRPGMAEVRAAAHRSRSPPAKARRRASTFATSSMLRAADILQPDLAICGGITEAMRIEPSPAPTICGSRRICGRARRAFFAGLHVCAAGAGELHPRIFARRQSDDPRSDRGDGRRRGTA